MFEKIAIKGYTFLVILLRGLNKDNITKRLKEDQPYGVDLSSGVESSLANKDINKIYEFIKIVRPTYYGRFGEPIY